jgi:hypothetical protein
MEAPLLGSVLRFPALGAGLGVGPDLGCAGVGDFLAVRRAASHGRVQCPRGQPDHGCKGHLSPWLLANLSCPNPVAPAEVLPFPHAESPSPRTMACRQNAGRRQTLNRANHLGLP